MDELRLFGWYVGATLAQSDLREGVAHVARAAALGGVPAAVLVQSYGGVDCERGSQHAWEQRAGRYVGTDRAVAADEIGRVGVEVHRLACHVPRHVLEGVRGALWWVWEDRFMSMGWSIQHI